MAHVFQCNVFQNNVFQGVCGVIPPPIPTPQPDAGGVGAPAFKRRPNVRGLYRPAKLEREPKQEAVEVAGTVITPDAVMGMSPLPLLMDFGNGPVIAGLRAVVPVDDEEELEILLATGISGDVTENVERPSDDLDEDEALALLLH